jgi:glycosyltransferase involved in cell wall biosynthesis
MNLAINAVSAKRGGAVTYLKNVLPELRRRVVSSSSDRIVVWRGNDGADGTDWPDGIEYRENASATGGSGAIGGTLRRLWFDQWSLPATLRRERVSVLFSSANFGPLRCPCRQVVLVRNPIYFDRTFLSRMRSRRVRAFYATQRWLTLRCMDAADAVVFPTRGMLDLVASWSRGPRSDWQVAHYGTRHDLFHPAAAGNPPSESVRLLHVSHYSEQKNLGTLLRAIQVLERETPGRFRLRMTAGFDRDWLGRTAFFPHFAEERSLFVDLRAREAVSDVDWSAYGALPDLYRSADVFVFPSYTESFGHPLVEAMATGLPIVAADTPVNRELADDAALYFPAFDAGALVESLRMVERDHGLRTRLGEAGFRRAREFTWGRHVDVLERALRGGEP